MLVNFEENDNVLEVINKIPQRKQVQYSLNEQLRELRLAANRLGLYDAADYLRSDNDKYDL